MFDTDRRKTKQLFSRKLCLLTESTVGEGLRGSETGLWASGFHRTKEEWKEGASVLVRLEAQVKKTESDHAFGRAQRPSTKPGSSEASQEFVLIS